MFKPLEDCFMSFVNSCTKSGYLSAAISNYRIEKENNKLCIYFEADLQEREEEEGNV